MKIIEESLFDDARQFLLSDFKDWSTALKSRNVMVTLPDKGTVIVKQDGDKIGIYDYESGNSMAHFNSLNDFKKYFNSQKDVRK